MTQYFTAEQRNGRWWFITPGGTPFWSIGMNHIDSAALRFAESEDVWEREFGNSQKRWLRSIATDLCDWGLNTIGWTQEVVIITESYHRHSRPFTFEEYQWADMPYCHLLPFTEAHQWQVEVNRPLPEEVVRAALPYVDVLSFQCFGPVDNIASKMRHWADFADRPVLLADAAGHIRVHGDTSWPPTADRNHDADHYCRVMGALWDIPQCVGYHLCGAHIRNNTRRCGFRDRANNPIPETIDGIRAVNAEMRERMDT